MVGQFLMIECDVPEGMTLREWSRARHPARERPALVRVVRRAWRAKRSAWRGVAGSP
jgi:hypothetical protein